MAPNAPAAIELPFDPGRQALSGTAAHRSTRRTRASHPAREAASGLHAHLALGVIQAQRAASEMGTARARPAAPPPVPLRAWAGHADEEGNGDSREVPLAWADGETVQPPLLPVGRAAPREHAPPPPLLDVFLEDACGPGRPCVEAREASRDEVEEPESVRVSAAPRVRLASAIHRRVAAVSRVPATVFEDVSGYLRRVVSGVRTAWGQVRAHDPRAWFRSAWAALRYRAAWTNRGAVVTRWKRLAVGASAVMVTSVLTGVIAGDSVRLPPPVVTIAQGARAPVRSEAVPESGVGALEGDGARVARSADRAATQGRSGGRRTAEKVEKVHAQKRRGPDRSLRSGPVFRLPDVGGVVGVETAADTLVAAAAVSTAPEVERHGRRQVHWDERTVHQVSSEHGPGVQRSASPHASRPMTRRQALRENLRALLVEAREAERSGAWPEAARRYERALEMAGTLKDSRKQRWISGHLGQAYLAWGEIILVNVRSVDDCRVALDLFSRAYELGFDGERNRGYIELTRACVAPAEASGGEPEGGSPGGMPPDSGVEEVAAVVRP